MVLRRLVLVAVALIATSTAISPPAAATEGATELEVIVNHDELTDDHAKILRLYWAFFGRPADPGGALYWIGQRDRCLGLEVIADYFAGSDEFRARYGSLDDEAFIELIYHHVLDRPGDLDGLAYWADHLATGRLSRGGVVLNVSLSPEFTDRFPYPSDGVPPRRCHLPDGQTTGRGVDLVDDQPLVTVAGLTLMAPATVIERAGFHQSSHPGALPMDAVPSPVRLTTMASRNRGTHPRGAIDIATEPSTTITAPISGTVARAGSYTLYCRYRDGFVVINPDQRPDLEVKILHIQNVAVRAGQSVRAGDVIAAHATTFPFRSQIDDLTIDPSWPHVHIEVVDPTVPRKRSSGGC